MTVPASDLLPAPFARWAPVLWGQEVLSADVMAVIHPDGTTSVTVRYEVAGVVDSIPLLGVTLLGALISDVRAQHEPSGDPLPVDFGPDETGRLTGSVHLDPVSSGARAPSGSVIGITLAYEVSQPVGLGDDFDLAIPIILVNLLPVGDRPELLRASFSVPADYAVVETFPLVPLDPVLEEGVLTYSLTLPVVPSMLRVRGRVGSRPFLTFGLGVDLGVGLVLILLGWVGWRQMRRPGEEAT